MLCHLAKKEVSFSSILTDELRLGEVKRCVQKLENLREDKNKGVLYWVCRMHQEEGGQ